MFSFIATKTQIIIIIKWSIKTIHLYVQSFIDFCRIRPINLCTARLRPSDDSVFLFGWRLVLLRYFVSDANCTVFPLVFASVRHFCFRNFQFLTVDKLTCAHSSSHFSSPLLQNYIFIFFNWKSTWNSFRDTNTHAHTILFNFFLFLFCRLRKFSRFFIREKPTNV